MQGKQRGWELERPDQGIIPGPLLVLILVSGINVDADPQLEGPLQSHWIIFPTPVSWPVTPEQG